MMDLKLLIASDGTAPLSVLAVAGLTAVSLTVEASLASASQPVLVLPNGYCTVTCSSNNRIILSDISIYLIVFL